MESEKENSNYIKPYVECKTFKPQVIFLVLKCPVLAGTFSITLTVSLVYKFYLPELLMLLLFAPIS